MTASTPCPDPRALCALALGFDRAGKDHAASCDFCRERVARFGALLVPPSNVPPPPAVLEAILHRIEERSVEETRDLAHGFDAPRAGDELLGRSAGEPTRADTTDAGRERGHP